MSPQDAWQEAVQHLVSLRGQALRGEQVALLALSAAGDVGAFALLSGFTFAVTDSLGQTRVLPAPHL